jgi:hypothetical protein
MSRERRNAKKYEKRDEKPKEDEGPRKPRRRRGEQEVEPVEAPKNKRAKK